MFNFTQQKRLVEWLRLFTFALILVSALISKPSQAAITPLVWEYPTLTNHAREGDPSSHFTYKVHNASTNEVVITDVKPSCGCTIATLPSKPWRLAPNANDKLDVIVDLRGKTGTIFKGIAVESPTAPTMLYFSVEIAPNTNQMSEDMMNRVFGQQLAAADRQAVFKQKECIACHFVPAFGKTGGTLYQAVCGICHEAVHRATMVPDLRSLKTEIDANYWRNWITHGKPGTLMPAFASTEGGPLDAAQINSLIDYLSRAFPRPIKSASAGNPNAKD